MEWCPFEATYPREFTGDRPKWVCLWRDPGIPPFYWAATIEHPEAEPWIEKLVLGIIPVLLRCGRAMASRCLTELENRGWIKVMRVGRFAGNRKSSLYRLTMFKCDERTGIQRICGLDGSAVAPALVSFRTGPGSIRNRHRFKSKPLLHWHVKQIGSAMG